MVYLGDGDDRLDAAGDGRGLIVGGPGVEEIRPNSAKDGSSWRVLLGEGDDVFCRDCSEAGGTWTVFGGPGNDAMATPVDADTRMYGGPGDDTLAARNDTGTIYGQAGVDVLHAIGPGSEARGGADDDLMQAWDGGRAKGGLGNDVMVAVDRYIGSDAPEPSILVGGPGNDELWAFRTDQARLNGLTGNDTCTPRDLALVVQNCEVDAEGQVPSIPIGAEGFYG